MASKNIIKSQNLIPDQGMDYRRLAFGTAGVNIQEKTYPETLFSEIKVHAEWV